MRHHGETLSIRATGSPVYAGCVIHLACGLACGFVAAAGYWSMPLEGWLIVEGLAAAAMGRMIGLPWWWMPINLFFFLALYLLLDWEVQPTLYLILFGVLFLLNAAACLQRVPLFSSSDRAAAVVHELLPAQGGFRFIDLGCGTGTFLARLACARSDGNYTGVELTPVPYWLSRCRTLRNRAVDIRWGSFWGVNLRDYDVVYAYLSPAPMARLWDKARSEMRPGSLLISNGFCIPGVAPTRTIALGDAVGSTLYLWRM